MVETVKGSQGCILHPSLMSVCLSVSCPCVCAFSFLFLSFFCWSFETFCTC